MRIPDRWDKIKRANLWICGAEEGPETQNKGIEELFSEIIEKKFQIVRKNSAHKESSWEKSHVQEQGLMAGSNCQAGWVKVVQHWLWARCGFYRKRSLRKLAHVWESLLVVELS
jgi:hypothetical protein